MSGGKPYCELFGNLWNFCEMTPQNILVIRDHGRSCCHAGALAALRTHIWYYRKSEGY